MTVSMEVGASLIHTGAIQLLGEILRMLFLLFIFISCSADSRDGSRRGPEVSQRSWNTKVRACP